MSPKRNHFKLTKKTRLFLTLLFATVLLLIPLIAAQLTDEVNWDLSDFAVMGILLYGVGISCELVLRKIKKTSHRLLLCVFLLAVFLLIWAELAVGIFGSPFSGS